MNVKAIVSFEVQKNGRNYVLYLENGAPFAEALEASVAIVNQIDAMAKAHAEKIEKEKSESDTAIEIVEDPT